MHRPRRWALDLRPAALRRLERGAPATLRHVATRSLDLARDLRAGRTHATGARRGGEGGGAAHAHAARVESTSRDPPPPQHTRTHTPHPSPVCMHCCATRIAHSAPLTQSATAAGGARHAVIGRLAVRHGQQRHRGSAAAQHPCGQRWQPAGGPADSKRAVRRRAQDASTKPQSMCESADWVCSVRSTQYACVITDQIMPVMSGRELTRRSAP